MLYECHGHIIADGVSYADAMARHQNGVDQQYVRSTLETLQKSGVGYYRDGGDKYGVSAYAKTLAAAYGIEYRTAVFIAHKSGYYGGMYGKSYDNLKEYRALIEEATAEGADFIKITVTGMLDFDAGTITGQVLPFDEVKEAVNIAHGEGYAVMAHVNGADSIKRALEAGVDSIEHGFWPDESVIGHFLHADAVWVPTCVTVTNLIGAGRYPDDKLTAIKNAQHAVLQRASARGVPIACGSDCGAWRVPQGRGTRDELEMLTSLGIDPTSGNEAIQKRFKRF